MKNLLPSFALTMYFTVTWIILYPKIYFASISFQDNAPMGFIGSVIVWVFLIINFLCLWTLGRWLHEVVTKKDNEKSSLPRDV